MQDKEYPDFWDDLKSGKFAMMVKEISKGQQVTTAKEIYNILKPIVTEHDDQESIYGVFMDGRNQIVAIEKLFTGSISSSMMFPRELIKRMLELKANGLILSHNHPSGLPDPSPEDKRMTRTVGVALASIDARLLDHIIIGNGYHCMAETGFINATNEEFRQFIQGGAN